MQLPTDIKMLELIDLLKLSGRIRFTQQFLDTIGLKKQNLRPIKKGTQHFTVEHVRIACVIYNGNANWINGLDENPFRFSSKEALTKKLTTQSKNDHFLKTKKIKSVAG